MSLSLLIPVRNESLVIKKTLDKIKKKIHKKIKYEIIVIDDFSDDNTFQIVNKIKKKNIKIYKNKKVGLGSAINEGIAKAKNEYICIFMADCSDDVNDIMKYYFRAKTNNLDAVFGSRFINNSTLIGYPFIKYALNRFFNYFVMIIFFCKFNDYTNAFKLYKKKILKSFLPIVSESFNVFLELPLKTIIRNHKYEVIPISWTERKKGSSKFKIKELGSKYFFTLIFCFFEKILLNKK